MNNICPYFGQCGGCQYQNLSKEEYIQLKKNFISNALKGQHIDFVLSEIQQIGAHTRRRITLAYKNNTIGFNKKKSHDIIPIKECLILTPNLENLLKPLSDLFKTISGTGDVSILMTEWGADINIKPQKETTKKHIKKKQKAPTQDILFLEQISFFCQQNNVARLIFDGEILYQALTLPFPSDVFMQPSLEGEAELVDLVVKGCQNNVNILDLFCGLGTFTKPLAKAGKKVLGMDITEQSIENLQKENFSAQIRDLFRSPLSAEELNQYDCVVLDPARAGAKAQCEQLAQSQVKRIVMVSCNPLTFARDCRILLNGGYELEKIIPVDQFIYSEHIELVAYLKKG